MEHLLKPLLPKLLLITPLVALLPVTAQSVNNPYATYSTVLNNPLYLTNHPNFSLLSATPLLNSSQSVPLTEIEIKPVIKQPVIPLADARFNQWGEAGLILRGRYPEKILPPSPEFSMVLPLFQGVDRFLLTQLSAQRNDLHGKQTAYSLGFGQRFWPLNQPHWWGTHLFYDHCPQGKHHRLGLVGEWQNSHARCTVNGYFPLSQWRLDKQNQLEKRPARSLDFRLQWFLFQKPCVNLNMLLEHAFSHSLTYPNQSAAAAHPTALTLGLSYTPVSLVTISYDAKTAHKGKPSHQLQIQFTYRLGIPLAQQFNPALATTGYDPATNRLSLIHRQSTMLLEQRKIPQPATLPVPPTSAEETQKPSESTPQAKQQSPRALGSSTSDNPLDKPPHPLITEKDSAEALNAPGEAVDTGQQQPIDTAANPGDQRARLSGNIQNPGLYPTLSPLTTPKGREPSREQKDTTTHLSPIQPQSDTPLKQREISPPATLLVPTTSAEETEQNPSESMPQAKEGSPRKRRSINDNHFDKPPHPSIADGIGIPDVPYKKVNTGQQKPNNSADKPGHQRASLPSDIQNPGLYPILSPLTTPKGREPSREQKAALPGNHHSLDSTSDAAEGLDASAGSGYLELSQNGDTRPTSPAGSSPSEGSQQVNRSLAVISSATPLLSQKTEGSWVLPTQVTDERLESNSSVESYLEKNSRSGTNTPNSLYSDFLLKSSGHSDDSSKVVQPPEARQRPMRTRIAPDRLSYEPTDRKIQTPYVETKHSQPSKMNNQQPQDSALLTTQTSLGEEEPTEQQQKSTARVHGLPSSPNISSPKVPSLLHNKEIFSSFGDLENQPPSTQTPEFGGGRPDPSTVLPTRRTSRPQKPSKPFTPTSDRSGIRKQSR